MALETPLYSVFAFLGFLISLIPLPWHLQAWNSGTCYYMAWTSLACLNQFVNSVVWRGNAINWAPVWCDISIRIMLGASVGIPAASLCINRRLYEISRLHAVTVTIAEKRRAILIDTLICVLFPIVFVALQYIVQGHRFDIYEGVGCYPFIYNTTVAFLLSDIWPIIIGLISAVYCCLSLRAFYRRRVQFNEFLSSNPSLTISRYFRLMALAMTEMICTIPLASFMIWLNATAQPVEPWISWQNTHYDFSRIGQYPSVLWTRNYFLVVAMQLSRWLVVVCAFIFFAYFGFAAEARKNYNVFFWRMATLVGLSHSVSRAQPSPRPLIMASHALSPAYIAHQPGRRRADSLASSLTKAEAEKSTFSDQLTTSEASSPIIPFDDVKMEQLYSS